MGFFTSLLEQVPQVYGQHQAFKQGEADRQRQLEREALQMALLEAQTDHTSALAEKTRRPPELEAPKPYTVTEVSGLLRGAIERGSGNPVKELLRSGDPRLSEGLVREAYADIQGEQFGRKRQTSADERAEGSQSRISGNDAERRMQSQLNAYAADLARAEASYDDTKAQLSRRFPNAPEYMVIAAADRAHDGGGDFEALIRAFQGIR